VIDRVNPMRRHDPCQRLRSHIGYTRHDAAVHNVGYRRTPLDVRLQQTQVESVRVGITQQKPDFWCEQAPPE